MYNLRFHVDDASNRAARHDQIVITRVGNHFEERCHSSADHSVTSVTTIHPDVQSACDVFPPQRPLSPTADELPWKNPSISVTVIGQGMSPSLGR